MFNSYDDNILIDARRNDARRLKCKPGNKQCGDRCIPASQNCRDGKKGVKSKAKKGGLTALAGAAIGGGVLIASRGRNSQSQEVPQKKRFRDTPAGYAAAAGVGLGAGFAAKAAGDVISATDRKAARNAARRKAERDVPFQNGPVVQMVDDKKTVRMKGGALTTKPSTGAIAKPKGSSIVAQPSGDIVVRGSKSNGLTQRSQSGGAITAESRPYRRGHAAADKVKEVAKSIDQKAQAKLREELNPSVVEKRRAKARKIIGGAISGTINAGRKTREFTDDVINAGKYMRDLNRRGRQDSAIRVRFDERSGSLIFAGTKSQRR